MIPSQALYTQAQALSHSTILKHQYTQCNSPFLFHLSIHSWRVFFRGFAKSVCLPNTWFSRLKLWSCGNRKVQRKTNMGLFFLALFLMVISANCADEGKCFSLFTCFCKLFTRVLLLSWPLVSCPKKWLFSDFYLYSYVLSMLDIPMLHCSFICVLILFWLCFCFLLGFYFGFLY